MMSEKKNHSKFNFLRNPTISTNWYFFSHHTLYYYRITMTNEIHCLQKISPLAKWTNNLLIQNSRIEKKKKLSSPIIKHVLSIPINIRFFTFSKRPLLNGHFKEILYFSVAILP